MKDPAFLELELYNGLNHDILASAGLNFSFVCRGSSSFMEVL